MTIVHLDFFLSDVGASAQSERGDKIPVVTLVHSTRCRYPSNCEQTRVCDGRH
jgi:hypothetical protein